MQLPRSVQDQIDNAQRLQAELNQPPAPENPAAPATPETPAAPAVDPAQSAAPDQAAHEETRDAGYWRHRFDVISGKYNAEVPALRKEIADLKQQIATAASTPQGSAVQRVQEGMADLTQAEIDEYGPDLVNLIKRVAGNAAAAHAGQTDLQSLKSDVDQIREEQQQDAQARFWVALEQQVPNFRTINANPAFLAWLADPDPMSGAPRQQLLVNAQQALDPYRVATIFRSFAGAAPQPQTIPEEQVQPRQSRTTSVEPSAGKVWTRADIAQFYRDKPSLPAAEAAALEADIFAAQAQGRIR